MVRNGRVVVLWGFSPWWWWWISKMLECSGDSDAVMCSPANCLLLFDIPLWENLVLDKRGGWPVNLQPVCSVARLAALIYFARCHCGACLQVSAAVTLPQFKIFNFKNHKQILRQHHDFQERFAWCISKVIFQLGWEMSCQVLWLLPRQWQIQEIEKFCKTWISWGERSGWGK